MSPKPPEDQGPSLIYDHSVKMHNPPAGKEIAGKKVMLEETLKYNGFVRAMGGVKISEGGERTSPVSASMQKNHSNTQDHITLDKLWNQYVLPVHSAQARLWLMRLAPRHNISQEDYQFHLPLINLIISDHFSRKVSSLNWLEQDYRKDRKLFLHRYIREAIKDPIMPPPCKGQCVKGYHHTSQNIHFEEFSIVDEQFEKAISYPLKLGIVTNEDIDDLLRN